MTSIDAVRGEVDMDSPPAWRVSAAAFTAAAESGRLDLPLPGSGQTRERWARLISLAAEDLSLARLGEGHADALAILAELGGPAPAPGARWGVWAAQPPGRGLTAARAARGWRLTGLKQYCSGARVLHRRPGHRGRAGRDPAVRGGGRRSCAGTRQLARDRDGGQRHPRRRVR